MGVVYCELYRNPKRDASLSNIRHKKHGSDILEMSQQNTKFLGSNNNQLTIAPNKAI